MSTSYFAGTIGATYYLKKLPLTISPWSTGLVTAAENGTTGQFSATTEDDQEYWALEQLGGSPAESDTDNGPIAIIPVSEEYADLGQAVLQSRSTGTTIDLYVDEEIEVTVQAVDVNGTAISLVGKTLSIVFTMVSDPDESYAVGSADITIATSNARFTIPAEITLRPSLWTWAMRDAADSKVIMQGICNVARAAVEV